MVKKYHFQLDAIDKQLVKLQSEQAEVEALQRQIGMTRDIEEAVKLQRQITEEEALKRQIGITPAIDQWLGTMRTAGLDASEIYRRQFNPTASEIFEQMNQKALDDAKRQITEEEALKRQIGITPDNPTASEIFEQMNQKAIDDAKLRGERPLTEIIFTPPYDFQRAESDRRDRQRQRDREHDIETARLAEIARLQVRDDHEASKQAAVVAGAALDAPVTNTKPQNTTAQGRKPKRRDLLAPLIQDAQNDGSDPEDAAAVFTLLRTWAQAKPVRAPLVGVTEDGRIQWRDSNDKPQELSSRALGQRLKRKQEASSKPTPTHQLKRVK